MYPAKMWSPSSHESDSCRTEYNNWPSRIASNTRTPTPLTQRLLKNACNLAGVPGTGRTWVIIQSPQRGSKKREATCFNNDNIIVECFPSCMADDCHITHRALQGT